MWKVLAGIIMLTLLFNIAFAEDPGDYNDYALGKGSLMISGRGGLNTQSGDRDYVNALEKIFFSPSVMYFLNTNVAIGAEGLFEKVEMNNVTSTGIAVGPVIAVFLGNEDSNDHPFVGGAYHLYHTQIKDYSKSDLDGYELVVGVGLMRMITDHVSLSGQFIYSYQNVTKKQLIYYPEVDQYFEFRNKYTGNVYSLVIGLNFFIY